MSDDTHVYPNGLPGMSDLPVPPPMTQPMYPQQPPAGWRESGGEHYPPNNIDVTAPMQVPKHLTYLEQGTQSFGIRVDTDNGRTYVSLPFSMSMYESVYAMFAHWTEMDEDSSFEVQLPEGVAIVRQRDVSAVIIFSYDWLEAQRYEQRRVDTSWAMRGR